MRSRKACIEQLAHFRDSGKLKSEEIALIEDVLQYLYRDSKQEQIASITVTNNGNGRAIGILNGPLTINID